MLKKYIREEVIKDSLFEVEAEMLSLKESIILQMISEGVDDPVSLNVFLWQVDLVVNHLLLYGDIWNR